MCGPPLLYLERCGHKTTPRFPAPPVNRLSICLSIRALASARGSVATRRVATGPRARRARGQRARPLEGPKGPRVAKTCETEGPRTSKAKCPSRCLPVLLSGRWQAPAAVLPPEGWQRGRGPEGPEDKGHGHSRARRAREWPKHASPRARRARGRAKLSARLGACQCYYMFFTTQLKIAKFKGRSQDLNVG